MMNYIFALMILASFAFSIATGNVAVAMDALTTGALGAVTLVVKLAGTFMLYMGLMGIAESCGLVEKLARAVRRPLRWLFPSSERAMGAITLNLAANFFGAGSAATPFGLEAMALMREEGDTVASDDMCMFLALNSAAIELVPAGVLALRSAAGSADVYSVVLPTFVCSVISFIVAAASAKLLSLLFPKKPR